MPHYFYPDASGNKQGPFSDQQLQELAAQGMITPYTPLETESGHKGIAGQIPGLDFASAAPFPFAQKWQGATPPYVPHYLVWSIITTLICAPLGIPAIIFSVLSGSDFKAGYYDEALRKSKIAFWCNFICLVWIIIWFALWCLLVVFTISGAMSGTGSCC
jgi:hypothetical protein